jgi:exosome complex component RRP41
MINVDKEHEVDEPEVQKPEVEQKPETEAKPETEIKPETENKPEVLKPEVLKPEVQKPEVEVRREGRMSIHEMEESLKRELTRDQCYNTFLRP